MAKINVFKKHAREYVKNLQSHEHTVHTRKLLEIANAAEALEAQKKLVRVSHFLFDAA